MGRLWNGPRETVYEASRRGSPRGVTGRSRHTHTYTHAHIHTYTHTHMHTYTHSHTHLRTRAHRCTNEHTRHMHTYTDTRSAHAHLRTHAHTNTHTSTHTHTHTRVYNKMARDPEPEDTLTRLLRCQLFCSELKILSLSQWFCACVRCTESQKQ